LRDSTRKEITRIVSSFIDSIPQIDKSQIEFITKAYPFHAAIFSEEAILYSKQERSIVTRMGMTLFPSLARVIALDAYHDVHNNYSIRGSVDAGSLAQIDRIINELREGGGKRKPDHRKELESILAKRTGITTEARVIADLYIGDHAEGPLFMEIKSPLPNIDVATESKKKILIFELMKSKEKGRGYLAFAYNPFITREKYAHSFTRAIMDMEEEVLMGIEMWDKLGGQGTYDELIKVVDEAGEAKRKELLGNKNRQGTL
jgi:hypothetical protein